MKKILFLFILLLTMQPFFAQDTDSDGIANVLDLDDDNDGILDDDENTCIASSKIEGTPIFINDFGTGATTTDPYVLNHTYTSGEAGDGFYNVRTSGTTGVFYTRTNITGDKDAGNPTITNGTTTGRYLMINIDSPNNTNKAFYRVTGINTQVGQSYRFRIDMAGLAEGAPDIPILELSVKDNSGVVLGSATSASLGMANDDVWRRLNLEFTATTSNVILEIINQQPSGGGGNDVGVDNIVFSPLYCNADNDAIPNYLDVDSDDDGCPDAVEGSENVSIEQVWSLNLPIADANYANRGKIKVIYDGITTNTQPNIVSQSAAALGVPQLVNNAGNNLNSITNPSNLAGLADNTDVPGPTTADIGQGVGASTNAAVNACICYNNPNTGTVGADTKHGITLLKRAGATPQPDNWPMERKSAFTALESNTKGFVITRMTTAEINALTGQSGMMVYDTDLKCLKLFDGTAWSCFNTPTCP